MKERLFDRILGRLGRAWPARDRSAGAASAGAPVAPPRPLRSRAFDERERAAVWNKGRPILGWDPGDWRVDHRGNPIFRHHYGDAHSAFGWSVGEVVPGRGDELANLRPELCHMPRPEFSPFERALDSDRFAN